MRALYLTLQAKDCTFQSLEGVQFFPPFPETGWGDLGGFPWLPGESFDYVALGSYIPINFHMLWG